MTIIQAWIFGMGLAIGRVMHTTLHHRETKMSRNDVHRPSEIVPADYSFVFAYSLATTSEGWPIPPYNMDLWVDYRRAGHLRGKYASPGRCDVCGAHFIYGEVWRHSPTDDHISIGHECARKYELLADLSEYKRERAKHVEQAVRKAKRTAARESMRAQLDSTPGLEKALETDHYIVSDIRSRFEQRGSISEKQVALVFKLAREAQEKKAEDGRAVAIPVTGKRITIEGTVLGTRWDDNGYGGCVKVLLRVDEGDGFYKVWMTMPDYLCSLGTRKGSRIRVAVKIEASKDDPTFGFGSRPTKGELLDACECGHVAGTNWHSCDKCRNVEKEEEEEERVTSRCPDCGEPGERKGHMTCQYPKD